MLNHFCMIKTEKIHWEKKNIFCIEGLWEMDDIQDKSTILPILELLERRDYCHFVYRDCVTIPELRFYLGKWKPKKISDKYPILYLAFHGEIGNIRINKKEMCSLDYLAEVLEGKCTGKVIYFGSCSTLNMQRRKIRGFLARTGALAVIGYKKEVDWIQSTACDMFVFEALQKDKLDTRGIQKIHDKIISDYGNLHRKLGLTVVINDTMYFPRKRKKK